MCVEIVRLLSMAKRRSCGTAIKRRISGKFSRGMLSLATWIWAREGPLGRDETETLSTLPNGLA